MAQVRAAVLGQAPKEPGVGKPPNPRKPRLVRDVDGAGLNDLFVVFPDLPWPRRQAAISSGKRDLVSGRPARRALGLRVR
jgi:hypothetical protein